MKKCNKLNEMFVFCNVWCVLADVILQQIDHAKNGK